jgi:hypothetical protein
VVLAIIVLVLIARQFYVPRGFGVYERGYMYSWHNKSNEEFWKEFTVKFKFNNEYCKDCHSDKYDSIMKSPHAIIKCEDCHGPALNHPENPSKLTIDRSRALCLRCHFPLPYPTSFRSQIRGIDPETHNPDIECASCHNPHKPSLEGLK